MDSIAKVAELRAKKKRKSEKELVKDVDIYGKNDIAWYDEDAEEKRKLRKKYKSLYEHLKDKQS